MKKATIMSQKRAERVAAVMEFIRFNTLPNAREIAEHMGCTLSMARDATTILLAADKIRRITHKKRTFHGISPDTFAIGHDATPFDTTRNVPGQIDRREQSDCRHVTVKAVQLGLKRDELIAAFYGPARCA